MPGPYDPTIDNSPITRVVSVDNTGQPTYSGGGGGGSVTQGTTPWVTSEQAATITTGTLQSAAAATGNGTVFSTLGLAEVRITVTITGTATITMEGTENGTDYFTISAEQQSAVPSSTITATGLYSLHTVGLQNIRARISAFTSGTVTVTAHGSPISAAPFLPKDLNGNVKVTNATLQAGEDQTANVQGIILKPVTGATYAPSSYTNATAITKANIKSTAGNVFSFRITNANAAPRYFQLHNKASAPAAAEVPIEYFLVPAGTANQPGVVEVDTTFLAPSSYFSLGIGWAISTTAATFTDSATATDHLTHVRYV